MDVRFTHLLFAQTLTILLGIYPFIHRRSRITYYFAGAHVCLALWCLNEAIAFIPIPHAARLLVFRISYVFGALMVMYFFRYLLEIAEMPIENFKRSWRVIQAGGIVSMLLTLTPWLTANIKEVHPFEEIPGPAYGYFMAFMLWGLGLPLYQLGRAYKTTHGHTRTQLKYLFFASCFAFLEGILFFISLYTPSIDRYSYYYFYLQVMYVGIIAYAMVAHHLLDITIIIRKTLEYSILTAILMAVYIGVITAGARVLEGWVGLSSSYSAALAALVVAFLLHPLRVWVQRIVDRKFFRHGSRAGETLNVFSSQLANPVSAADIAKALIDVLDGSIHFKVIGLYLRAPNGRTFQGYVYPPTAGLPARMTPDNSWVANALVQGIEPVDVPKELNFAGAATLFPMRGQSGLVGFLLVGEKFSEEKLSEQDVQLIKMAITQSSMAYEHILYYEKGPDFMKPEVLADVARGVVHEIKTPLVNISMPAQAIMRDLDALQDGNRSLEVLLPKFKERMKFIMTQAIKAGDRIDAIRQYASLEDNRLEPTDLAQSVNDSIESLEPLLEKYSVRVHYKSPEGLRLVRANPKHLEIVFVNLIKNGAEAMTDEMISPEERHLWVKSGQEGDFYVVEVKDSGPGIKPEVMPQLFDKYFTTKGVGGTGVGLYLVRQLIEAMGGTISVKSEPGFGASFLVRLPTLTSETKQKFQEKKSA